MAFLAGRIPKIIPVHTVSPTAITRTSEVIVSFNPSNRPPPLFHKRVFKRAIIPRLNNIAIIPPRKVIRIDSIKNCVIISLLKAPMAFLIPISLVLSVTDTIIIFITPIPPTSSEIPPIIPKKILNPLMF